MNKKYIIVFLIVFLIIILLNFNTKNYFEHIDGTITQKTPAEAILNLSSMYNSDVVTTNNMKLLSDLVVSKNSKIKGKNTDDTDFEFNFNEVVLLKKTLSDLTNKINDIDMRIYSHKKCGGFAIDGEGTTMLLFEGYWHLGGTGDLNEIRKFDAWTNQKWDVAYLYKGWAVDFYTDINKLGRKISYINKDSDVLRCEVGNAASSYELKWVGF